ncbi:MAG: ABC transporter ATP-binding protein [Bacteroidetes bacterium]|nr:ABC transporter ATP-binding protein [Bacteroidota bacterium]
MIASLSVSRLKKTFNRRVIFQNISFSVASSQTLLITGRNGSGKSTLLKILCGLLTPTGGDVRFEMHSPGTVDRLATVGMVSPYLQMYDEFSAEENLRMALAIRGLPPDENRVDELLRSVGLQARRRDPVRAYSSGMKQRVKYAFALVHNPSVLMLDEPMANLDTEGIQMVRGIMGEHRSRGILAVATNDLTDVDHFDEQVNLDDPQKV